MSSVKTIHANHTQLLHTESKVKFMMKNKFSSLRFISIDLFSEIQLIYLIRFDVILMNTILI